uniref:Small RNA 2'-O-methyltransferase n=1 Tax=Periophthalmus magnuspinnatus TaxID=409849 RepID=A0A3B3ZI29_9GOBI
MEPFFNPPLHKQRHQFVIDFIKKYKTKKVMDLGCSECTLLKRLKFHREIEHLVGVDINGAKVKKKMHALAPLSTDYLQPGFEQLCVELYQGSVTEPDARLRGFHLAVSIELIEHLLLPDVERFSEVLFGYMAPVHVIISTPNSEFNPLFPGLTGFRHPDHKFEWTRAQFQSWAQRVCVDFEYEVEITGVGLPPGGGLKQFGFCSQIAVFHRLKGGFNISPDERSQGETSYTLLQSINMCMCVCLHRGCVAVPLSLLWASSPRVVALSGSLSNLRLFLMDEPMVKLSQDKSALLLQTDEEVYEGDLEDCGYTEIEQNQSVSPKTLENWEED